MLGNGRNWRFKLVDCLSLQIQLALVVKSADKSEVRTTGVFSNSFVVNQKTK